ncbi:H/ACA ribonucleoprotein complex non-core subunit NAF1 [Forsythia ovata]|uniref:H/ACA ribonucleoprotein complex non-core subunit NAF1 n=1 Tax=Forsythia ovata TaxID=205694 RepID=A0ABD1U4W5_9LAMI
MGLPTGMPGNGIQWVPQPHPQQLYQMPLSTGISLQHQSNTIPKLPFNFILLGGQANFGGSPTFAPWIGQNVFNQSPFGMGLPGQQPLWQEMWKDKRFNLMDRNCSSGRNAHGV